MTSNFNLAQKFLLFLIISLLRLLNFINIEIKWLLFIIFTFSLTLSFWNVKDYSLDDFMSITRRKPVLSLNQTIPENLLKFNSYTNDVLAKKIEETRPPVKILKINPVNLLAKSYIVYDYKNNREISSINKSNTLPPASLVKVLSVMYLTRDMNFSDKFKMTSECTLVNGQKVGFRIDEEVSVKELVYSSLIFSGADSICLLSRINPNYNISDFNIYAKKIGLKNSNFTNFIGLDFIGNYTTSEDMLIMTKEFLQKEIFSEIVKIKTYRLENNKYLNNTNKMLFSEKFSAGIKTGTTDGANENLIYRHKDDINDLDVLVVILNSANRYSDINQIIKNLYFE